MNKENINLDDVREFYRFFTFENPQEIRVFDKNKYPQGKSFWINSEQEFVNKVYELNVNEEVDVYLGTRDRKGKKDQDIVSSNIVFIEIDEHDMEKPKESKKLKRFFERNNIKIGLEGISGGGYHYYIPMKKKYFENEEDRENYKKVLHKLKEILKSKKIDIDPQTFNLSRHGRVLGTFNHKRGKISKIIKHNKNINLRENRLNIISLIENYKDISKNQVESTESAENLLKKYNIHKIDPWLYDMIKNKVIIKKDTGGNSVFFKTAAIILAKYNIPEEERRTIAKAVANLVEERTLASLYGWIDKAFRNELAEITNPEVDKAITNGSYPLTRYKDIPPENQSQEVEGDLNLLTFRDYKNLKTRKDYLIEDFLYPKTTTMMYSPPGHFKSLLAQYMAFCISNKKKDFLNLKTKKERCPVLYLDGENSDHILKERFEQIYKGMRLKRYGFPFYVLKEGFLIDNKRNVHEGYLMALEKEIEKRGIKVIIIDTLHRFAFYDENSSDDINTLYTRVFKPLIEKYGISIVFLHHSTKPDKSGKSSYRGSGDFLGMVDVSYSIHRTGKSNKFKIINEKCRSGEIEDISGEIDFQEEYIKFNRLDESEEKKERVNRLKEVTNNIKSLFKDDTALRRKEIVDHFEIKEIEYGSTKTIDRALKFLVENEYLDKDEKGKYKKILR